MAVTKSDLLKRNKRRFKLIDLPGGGQARIRSLSSGEMRDFRRSMLNPQGKLIKSRSDNMHELLIAQCLVDDEGNRLFTDEDAMSSSFAEIDGSLVSVLSSECRSWTGFGTDPDWSAIEDAAKNSEPTSGNTSTAA